MLPFFIMILLESHLKITSTAGPNWIKIPVKNGEVI